MTDQQFKDSIVALANMITNQNNAILKAIDPSNSYDSGKYMCHTHEDLCNRIEKIFNKD